MSRTRSHKRFTLAVTAFKSLARYTWKNLGARHSLKMRWPEIAITNELVYRLAKAKLPHVQVYEAINEKLYGHDIDLYIEVLPDQYVLLCLQAKVMYARPYTRYDAIDHKVKDPHTGTEMYQWELLNRFRADRIPFYLFYNGFSPANYSTKVPLGKRRPFLSLLGCSILSLDDFEKRFLDSSWQLSVPKTDINYAEVNEHSTEVNAISWHHLFDIERWLSAAYEANGGQKIQHHAGVSVLNNKMYRKLEPTVSSKENVPQFEDFPNSNDGSNFTSPAAFRVLVSMSGEELSESRRRKLALLLA
jgi:hypothetical protein